MDDTVDSGIKQLRTYRDRYFKIIREFDAGTTEVYLTDLIYRAALKRSLALHRGFCDLVQSRNFTCAAPLVRLQLDNCLRLVALDYVADQSALVLAVVSGEPISKMRAATGENLTDKFLCNKIALQHPWINSLYDKASGYIHLSEEHVLTALSSNPTDEDRFTLYIGDYDPFVSPETYLRVISDFAQATELFFAIVVSWVDEIRSKYYRKDQDSG